MRQAAVFLLVAAAVHSCALADTVTIVSGRDNTLYQDNNGLLSNGAGEHLFAGRTDGGLIRRGLVWFDVSVIPAGSTITNATLTLNLSRSRSGTQTISVHPVFEDWGEGTSVAGGEEGGGGSATAGDATWLHTFYNSQFWSTAGGSFASTPSASLTFGNASGPYSWSAAGLIADVQTWLDAPSSNFGWMIRGDEVGNKTTKRFDTHENATAANRPMLTVEFTPPGGVGACCLPDESCILLSSTDCAAAGGEYQGDGTSCTPDPCDTGGQTTIAVIATADNTLYESATGSLSNGAGQRMFAGLTDTNTRDRAVLRFDVSAIPSNATIIDASLELYQSFMRASVPNMYSLHRLQTDWGEGTSDATGNESAGAASTLDDATWIHTYYDAQFWSTAGGDYLMTPSAMTSVPAAAGYSTWNAPGMASDVQAWVQDPLTNYGWVLIGDEASVRSQRGFDTREGTDPSRWPILTITYTVGETPTGACCFPDTSCIVLTQPECNAQGGTYQGDGTTCDGVVCPLVLEPFVDPLPIPPIATPTSGSIGGEATYDMAMMQVQQQLHRDLPPTTVWGYNGFYPGPTIVARHDLPVTVNWINDLRDENGQLRTDHYLSVDLCPHGAENLPKTVVHLHGGHVPEEVDGYPEFTFLPGQQVTYTYPNNQDASLIWYHDHALGITRLNVYMGLAGGYIVRDENEDSLNLPSGPYEIPLIIQDRTVNADGSLSYPTSWRAHVFGDRMLVNGKIWPYLEVNQGKYRFRTLNGCNSRTLSLSLSNAQSFQVIGSEGGLLETPATLSEITLGGGERADIIIDFAGLDPGTEVVLENSAPAPYPGSPGVGVVPQVMKFIVTANSGDTDPIPGELNTIEPLDPADAVEARDFVLTRQSDPCAGSEWLINGMHWNDITEFPRLETTEVWRFINDTSVSHPMHMHLVFFQVVDYQAFEFDGTNYNPVGDPTPPAEYLSGWKDTVMVPPMTMVRVIARFEDYMGLYPYHCHILEHEDHEMMRQFQSVCTADYASPFGVLDFFDVQAFLSYFSAHDPRADLTGEGAFDFFDVQAFLQAFASHCQ